MQHRTCDFYVLHACGKGGTCDSATFKVTELFSTTHSMANVCLWSLHDYVLDFIPLLAIGVAKTPELNSKEGCPHTFGHAMCGKTFTLLTGNQDFRV